MDQTRKKWLELTGGAPSFNVASNYVPRFTIGSPEGDDVWLRGELVGDDRQPVFSGHLFLSDGSAGTVIDNFPKGPTPNGWTKRQRLNGAGYELVDDEGRILFGFSIDEYGICDVTVNLYDMDGETVATANGQDGLITNGAAVGMG